jgi:hypothetical protein
MMKKFVALVFTLINFQIYAQQGKEEKLTEKVFYSDYTEEDKSVWPLKNNQYYSFFIQNGRYNLSCLAADKRAYILPKGTPRADEFRIEASVILDNSSDGDGTFGIALNIQEGLTGGYLFEVNRSRQYRVTVIEGAGKYSFITGGGKKEGWVSYKDMNKTGKMNRLGLIQQAEKFRFTINNKEVFSLANDKNLKGQSGLFISGIMKCQVNDFTIFGPAPLQDEAPVTGNPPANTQSNDEVIKSDGGEGADATALTNALLECRKNSQLLSTKLDNTELETAQLKTKNKELTDFIAKNLDTKLQGEVDKQKKKTEELLLENFNLHTENTQLKAFKKNVEGGKEGDLVIVLSEKLTKEQEKTAALQKEIEVLKKQLKQKKK